MFINVSNHSSENWSEEQIRAAECYGDILDMPFPNIKTSCSKAEMNCLVRTYYDIIISLKPDAVMLQGEFVFTFRLATLLLRKDIPVFAAVSERVATESIDESGKVTKTSRFVFSGFRPYIDDIQLPDIA